MRFERQQAHSARRRVWLRNTHGLTVAIRGKPPPLCGRHFFQRNVGVMKNLMLNQTGRGAWKGNNRANMRHSRTAAEPRSHVASRY
jgi:hypothetical protein